MKIAKKKNFLAKSNFSSKHFDRTVRELSKWERGKLKCSCY
jgi:hypothetical protein